MTPVMSADCWAPEWSWLARFAMLSAISVSVFCKAPMSAPMPASQAVLPRVRSARVGFMLVLSSAPRMLSAQRASGLAGGAEPSLAMTLVSMFCAAATLVAAALELRVLARNARSAGVAACWNADSLLNSS